MDSSETNQFARDFLPFGLQYDANIKQGNIFMKARQEGYYEHTAKNSLGSSRKEIYSKFEMKILNVKAGIAVLIHSATIHGTWATKKKGHVKYVYTIT